MRRIEVIEADEYNKSFLVEGLSFLTDYATITVIDRSSTGLDVRSVSALIRNDLVAEFYQSVGEDFRTMIGLRTIETGTWMELKGVAKQWLETESIV